MSKNIFVIIVFLSCISLIEPVTAQNLEIYNLFLKFIEYNNSGNFSKAEECMLEVLEPANKPPLFYIIAANNNLGLVRKNFGQYDQALKYYDISESYAVNRDEFRTELAYIYSNKARIYTFRKAYTTAIEYLEKAIRIYQAARNPDRKILDGLSTAYLNIGIVYYESNDYTRALGFFIKSEQLILKFSLPDIELVYANLAKTLQRMNDHPGSEKYFIKSIDSFKKAHGENYYRLAEAYFSYGVFLRETGRYDDAIRIHRQALVICLRNYGKKHSMVSYNLKFLGDDYSAKQDYKTALGYYQRALIAVVTGFNDTLISSNPSIDTPLFDIRLLDDLKGKAQALELYANELTDHALKLRTLYKSIETIELALQLTGRIRNNYPSEESRIYLAENEKETFLSAIHLVNSVYALTGEDSLIRKMYRIAQMSKAAVLYNDISGNELIYSANIPDSLKQEKARLSGSIAAINKLITEASQAVEPDSTRILKLKDLLFDLKRRKEKTDAEIDRKFPQYHDLLQKTQPVGLTEIQNHLDSSETVIDYLVSGQRKDGRKSLYIFVITRKKLWFRETGPDSLFQKNVLIIKKADDLNSSRNFTEYTGALNYMFENLIRPFAGTFAGNRLIIIPDEELNRLPFDAFLVSLPGPDQKDYEGLHYLINDYTISYGYSSSLIFSKNSRLTRAREVFAFSPDYGNNDTIASGPDRLAGARRENRSIYKWFRGVSFTGDKATKANFLRSTTDTALFHLAMHSVADTLNPDNSYLLFGRRPGSVENSRLYNWEISLSRIRSPMVVLSACNSGTGTLYHSEGQMSLARAFILAGASSVISTAWDVNDATSAGIISRFYYYLAKGRHKDEAMRSAKLDYLRSSQPAYSVPCYWAAYKVLGDTAPVRSSHHPLIWLTVPGLVVVTAILIFYLSRRRIFSDRSR